MRWKVKKTANAPEDEETDSEENKGQLIVDATCAPADIRYPTDISLLNEARVCRFNKIRTTHQFLLAIV